VGHARLSEFRLSRRADVIATFLTTTLNKTEVIEFCQIAGLLVGIGDWRPEYGQFTTVQIE
jgi:hypothetical protein